MAADTGHGDSLRVLTAMTSGSYTHAQPLLEIGKALIERKHTVYYAASGYQLQWAADIDSLHTVELHGRTMKREDMAAVLKSRNTDGTMQFSRAELENIFTLILDQYDVYYPRFKAIMSGQAIEGGPIDIAICDFFSRPCIDVAHELAIPCVVTTFGAGFGGFAGAPYLPDIPGMPNATLENASFWQRFDAKVITPIWFYLNARPLFERQYTSLARVHDKPYVGIIEHYDKSLVLITTMPWFDPEFQLQATDLPA
ncbi:hypothetical protein SYNPS1DRAFT_21794 [Syncephalis pseudoplumigaleata]|uniref:Glycosyltransferase family 1 protein n=1 Tax=Syncephalis pseudoplumigaleata TaxID=1712513 RepID=A0A4P9Z1X1_9FUNG|nr:hypothetical protein SYNPS1DRAFT_21794 [Syncephalis pseudoplumigaleata]|eukprot:RKP26454.1 hypothetical protein SYNPS1DRAFT_21794 [Syncephalis pseudoplumigaleata]